MKKIICKQCPATINTGKGYFCTKHQKWCEDVDNCTIKTITGYPLNRGKYIKNKLSSCMGYSEHEKKIRCEEMLQLSREYINNLGIQIIEVDDV